MLRVSDLSAGYGRTTILQGLSLRVEAGEIVTLIGANGAGKTTLLRAISGLVRPSAGSIELNGERVDGLSPAEIVGRGLTMVPEARQIGAVNAVRVEDCRLIGTMVDGAGFVGGLRAAGIEPAGMRVYLAGAGGAANAVAFALAEAGVRHMSLANRTRAKAEALRNRVAAVHPALSLAAGDAELAGHDLLVNATSLGLSEGDPLPFFVDRLRGGEIVAEIIMQPEVTPLLAAAGARGCRTHLGQPMLSSQLNLMAEFLGIIDEQP
jgi:energy-coupling factor transporter ATP-binding protein EcfA2